MHVPSMASKKCTPTRPLFLIGVTVVGAKTASINASSRSALPALCREEDTLDCVLDALFDDAEDTEALLTDERRELELDDDDDSGRGLRFSAGCPPLPPVSPPDVPPLVPPPPPLTGFVSAVAGCNW